MGLINDLIKIIFGKHIRKKLCKVHFGEDDIIIENYCLSAVNVIPIKITEGMEVDYYINNGNDFYLLRLQSLPENKILFVNRNDKRIGIITYIVVRKLLLKNIVEELKIIINVLNKTNFPKYYDEKTYEIENWK